MLIKGVLALFKECITTAFTNLSKLTEEISLDAHTIEIMNGAGDKLITKNIK